MAAPKNPEGAKDASIITMYEIGGSVLSVSVQNNTNKIMIIDKTKSFFIGNSGSSSSFYNPNVSSTTKTDISSETNGASVNMGAVAGSLGVRGPLGTLMSGINVGGAETTGHSESNTTYYADQPRLQLPPKAHHSIGVGFIAGLGEKVPVTNSPVISLTEDPKQSPSRCRVHISYSLDGGNTFQSITTEFYVSSQIGIPVKSGRELNGAFQTLYKAKPDALFEPWWNLMVWSNIKDYYYSNDYLFIDYQ